MPAEATRATQGLRFAAFAACVALSFAIVLSGIVAAARLIIEQDPAINLNIASLASRRLPSIASARTEAPRTRQIVILGDSTLISYRPGRQVPDRLEAELARLAPDDTQIEIVNLAISGVAAFDYYFLADEIIRARPDGVLFSFNLDTASRNWRNAYSRPELAGMLAPGRFFETAAMPIHWVGLTVDRLLFYISVVQAGGFEDWYQLAIDQARLGRIRTRVRDAFDAALGSEASIRVDDAIDARVIASVFIPSPESRIARFTARGIADHYADTMAGLDPDHPVLVAMGATIARFEEAGIPSFVFVAPTNIEHIDALGMLDRKGLDETLARVEEVARKSGADFVDLHALLPDPAFRDGTGHFKIGERHDGPATLASALAQPFLEHVRSRYETGADSQ